MNSEFDATDELKVHIFTNKGEEIVIEYERSKWLKKLIVQHV